jgi:hypothetical protein
MMEHSSFDWDSYRPIRNCDHPHELISLYRKFDDRFLVETKNCTRWFDSRKGYIIDRCLSEKLGFRIQEGLSGAGGLYFARAGEDRLRDVR